ncbi:hypothetical protein Bca4012_036631 [Brassica carinata]
MIYINGSVIGEVLTRHDTKFGADEDKGETLVGLGLLTSEEGAKEDISMENTTDVKRKMTPSIPASYVSIIQLRERWIKEKERKRKEQEEEARRRNHHAEEEHIVEEDPKKPREDLDEMRLDHSDQKHWGSNSKKDESIDGGAEEEETAAIGSEGGEDEGLPEKKRGRRKRYHRKKKRTNQEVEECGSIKPPEYTVKENNTPAMGNKSVEKAVTAIETQFKDLSIKRGQETKHFRAQTRSFNHNPIETAAMVWVKKGQTERGGDGFGSGVKPFNA